jgi:galactose mutarotase-like enzyme
MLCAMAEPDARTPITLRDRTTDLALTVLPAAGMLVTSLTHRGDELLGQRRGVEAYLRDGKTMGIPLLHPWANRVAADAFVVPGTGVPIDLHGERPGLRRDPHGLAIHGVLAADPGWRWELDPAGAAEPQAIRATFDFGARPELLAAFPFPHRLDYAIRLDAGTVSFELGVTATGDVPVPVAHGFHPYLTLPGVPRAQWHVELPPREHLELDARGIPTGARVPEAAWAGELADRTFDDAYDGLANGATWVLEGGDRRIVTTFCSGYPAAQLFAPLEDPVICFEPMAAPTNALVTGRSLRVAAPGDRDVARMVIAVQSAR